MYYPDLAVKEAEADVGFVEGNNNYNPYSDWQYGNPWNPYCNSATSYWSWLAGFRFWSNCTYGEKGEAYTPTYAIKAREHGVWRDKWWKAHPGDDVEFDWGNNGLIDHVEKVVADDGTTVITVGGNTGNGVFYRRRDRAYISNFVALSEAGQTATQPKPPEEDAMKITDRVDAARRVQGGHYIVDAAGGVFSFNAPFYGSIPGLKPTPPKLVVGKNHAVSILVNPDGDGYWILLFDGSVYSFGKASYKGHFHLAFTSGGFLELVALGDSYRAIRRDGAMATPHV